MNLGPIRRAFLWYGEKEQPGPKANNFITDCLATTTLPKKMVNSDETAWCSAFINKIVSDYGIDGTGSALARSWLDWGYELKSPLFGCICVLWRISKDSKFGHVGFLVRATSKSVFLYGGNQNNMVNISEYPRKRVLGFRMK